MNCFVTERNANGTFAKTRTKSWSQEDWDDGWIDRKGKFHVYRPDYPNCSASGWAFRYHIVWWLVTGQVVRHPLALHHINHQPLDDYFENLQLMQAGDHTSHHSKKPLVEKECQTCGVIFARPAWKAKKQRWCSIVCARNSTENRERQRELQRKTFLGKSGKKCFPNCKCLRHNDNRRNEKCSSDCQCLRHTNSGWQR